MTEAGNVLIVGASVAGMAAAGALRRAGHGGSIMVVGDEAHPPYTRPPLSKGLLSGTQDPQDIHLPPADEDIELRLSTRATGLDIPGRIVAVVDDRGRPDELPFDGLVIATGSRPRRLTADADELVLQTVDDCDRLGRALRGARSVLVVGGGLLGMEIASTSRAAGCAVTVVDREPPMLRQLGPALSDVLVEAAGRTGIELRVSPSISPIVEDGRLAGVVLETGVECRADVVVTSIGSLPNVEWLSGSGLEIADGVVVDEWCLAADRIAAAGDVARLRGAPRTPQWTSASDQGAAAARAVVTGRTGSPYQAEPYYWTDQSGLSMKVCGLLPVRGTPIEVQGSLADGGAVLQFHTDGQPVTAASVNYRIPVGRLRRLTRPAPTPEPVGVASTARQEDR